MTRTIREEVPTFFFISNLGVRFSDLTFFEEMIFFPFFFVCMPVSFHFCFVDMVSDTVCYTHPAEENSSSCKCENRVNSQFYGFRPIFVFLVSRNFDTRNDNLSLHLYNCMLFCKCLINGWLFLTLFSPLTCLLSISQDIHVTRFLNLKSVFFRHWYGT